VKDLSPETPIFSLEAQMRMRYQAVDHDGVNIGAFCLRMRENRSVRLQMADFKGFVSFVMVFMKNMD
jgi:hypothetical protein